jgi:hypothetical protein
MDVLPPLARSRRPWLVGLALAAAIAALVAPAASATVTTPGSPDERADHPGEAHATRISLRGRVLDPRGRAVSSATVLAVREADAAPRRTVTDADGRFSFPDLPPGSYVFVAIHGNHSPGRSDPVVVGSLGFPFPLRLVVGTGEHSSQA